MAALDLNNDQQITYSEMFEIAQNGSISIEWLEQTQQQKTTGDVVAAAVCQNVAIPHKPTADGRPAPERDQTHKKPPGGDRVAAAPVAKAVNEEKKKTKKKNLQIQDFTRKHQTKEKSKVSPD